MMMEYFKAEGNEDIYEDFKNTVVGKGYTYDIPKSSLLVKLKPGLSALERDVISNGIRFGH
jgi:hypothetical protein